MAFSVKLPEQKIMIFLVLAVLYILTCLLPLIHLPLIRDESLYGIMIDEQAANPTLIPTLFGYQVFWKPILFFWVYSLFAHLPLPLEAVYRFPSFLFGLATLVPFYCLLRNTGASRNASFFTVLVSIFSLVTIYSNVTVLTDTLNFFLIMCSLYLYSEKRFGDWRFLAAAALAFAAFFVKLLIAFMVPVLAIVYFYTKDRKVLRNRLFIISLLAVPLAFLLHHVLLESLGLSGELYLSIKEHFLTGYGIMSQIKLMVGSATMLFFGAGIWLVLSLFGLWKHWRDNLFMTCWYALTIFPLLSGYFMPWYFLPVFPAISYFAVIAILRWEGKEKADAFFVIFLSMAVVATLLLNAFVLSTLYFQFLPEKEAGLLLAGKENVMVVGNYAPGIIAYKMGTEYRSGGILDMGWVMAVCNITDEQKSEFIRDYHSDKYHVVDGSFSNLFATSDILRKDTNITSFDYIAVVAKEPQNISVAGEPIYESHNIIVYRVD